ncbi:uncharacterized protein MELLADRAFT_67401 [Melampsora larici-populina 98AG31]|uniref:Uncharacterized protein n=1 Tax=Melampsora larici-populina (strain 98AG31 / pathotype 3-4-7) TaxID=747676 RepID=F4S307_MELLP|nr:uncharacterized protein MELLADRAFT_67401 [Melampsora larici-populina 98AG31]EGG00987.1 hypothetical protein MELLADRAFT_67401 [Melampsora larici-populina 98AG31]
MDRSSTFELYYDPEISAPQNILPSSASPVAKPSSLYPPTPTGIKSSPQLLSPSRRSLRPSVSTGRLVLGELPLRTRVNPFHRSQRNKASCGRRQSATCDSRLKHEIYLFPEVSAPSNHLNASDGDKVDDRLPNDLPTLARVQNLRRSAACGPQTRTVPTKTAGDIILPSDNSTCFASGSSTPAAEPVTSRTGHSSSLPPPPFTLPTVSSTVSQSASPIELANVVEETKENVPLARTPASPAPFRATQTPAKTGQAAHPDHPSIMTPYQPGNDAILSGVQSSCVEDSSVSVSSLSSKCRLNATKSTPLYDPSNRRHLPSFPWANSDEVSGALLVSSRKPSLTAASSVPSQYTDAHLKASSSLQPLITTPQYAHEIITHHLYMPMVMLSRLLYLMTHSRLSSTYENHQLLYDVSTHALLDHHGRQLSLQNETSYARSSFFGELFTHQFSIYRLFLS